MHVRTDNSRDECHRIYSPRKYNDRFRRKTSRHDDHHSHSSRHHPLKRSGNSQSNPYNSHSRLNRDTYYHSSPIIHERELPIHYNDSQVTHHRYSYSSSRRETSPPATTRQDYRSSFDPYNEMYYSNRSERYDISQNRIGSITTTTASSLSPIYHSDSYPPTSMYNNPREQYPSSISPAIREMDYRTRDYPPMINHHPTNSNLSSKYYRSSPSYDFKRPRSNSNEMNCKRSMIRR